MLDSTKYLIRADVFANGVVERSDVVGAIYGQTEGLLGDDMNLHDLQQASKVGRIEVEIESEQGRSRGRITIASNLDKVETAVLAAALETIDRVGPCRSTITVNRIEDVRAATRREIVDRAHELLTGAFDDTIMSSDELIDAVRERVRIADVTEYKGYPAGPRVADSDAIIVVEGRADVVTLLKYGIKNAVAVEGTDVPDEIAELTLEKTTTAFLDGDRGGELILRELDQVGAVDSVAFAPPGRSVEDLDRDEVMAALQRKRPVADVLEGDVETGVFDGTGSGTDSLPSTSPESGGPEYEVDTGQESGSPDDPALIDTLRGHVEGVLGEGSGTVRFLDGSSELLEEGPLETAFETLETIDTVPHTIVLDGTVDQRLLDVATDRGVAQIIGRTRGDFTKQPTAVRVLTVEEYLGSATEQPAGGS